MTSFTKLLTAAAVIGGVAAPAVAQTPYPYGYPQQQPAYPQPAPGQPGYGYSYGSSYYDEEEKPNTLFRKIFGWFGSNGVKTTSKKEI